MSARSGLSRAALGHAAGVTVAVVAWGYLVKMAIDFGADARQGKSSGWVFLGLAALGAMACLFLGLMMVSRFLEDLRGGEEPEPAPIPAASSAPAPSPYAAGTLGPATSTTPLFGSAEQGNPSAPTAPVARPTPVVETPPTPIPAAPSPFSAPAASAPASPAAATAAPTPAVRATPATTPAVTPVPPLPTRRGVPAAAAEQREPVSTSSWLGANQSTSREPARESAQPVREPRLEVVRDQPSPAPEPTLQVPSVPPAPSWPAVATHAATAESMSEAPRRAAEIPEAPVPGRRAARPEPASDRSTLPAAPHAAGRHAASGPAPTQDGPRPAGGKRAKR